MYATKVTRGTRNITCIARPAKTLANTQLRFQSTAVEANNDVSASNDFSGSVPETDVSSRHVLKNHPELGTPQLNKVFGKERIREAKYLKLDIKKLRNELSAVYGRQRVIHHLIKGPLSVRESIGTTGTRTNANIIVGDDNKIVVGGKNIPNIWLRDNCQCSSCMHESTKQRLQDTFAIPKDLSVTSASLTNAREAQLRELTVEWSDGHQSKYSQPFLANALQSYDKRSIVRQGLVDVKLWDSSIASNPPIEPFELENATGKVLEKIRKFGFCYVDETPFDHPTATEDLLKRIAFIRETHYGGFYDFTADLASQDTAYTNIALEAHTDNTYFSDPAGLQAFHLLSHTDGSGGASLLVDGFKVADELFHQDKEAYKILSSVNVHAHASGNDGISIQPYRGFPVLEHDPSTGDLLRVRWNSSDRASIELPIDEVETWYDAARKFDALLKKKENEYWEQLTPGRVLIFDNWRVLHGRSAFTGKRRICGGYLNRDDWISKWKMHRYGQEKVMEALASS